MNAVLIARCIAAALAGAGWAYVVFKDRDPFDDGSINDRFYDKVDEQVDRFHRR